MPDREKVFDALRNCITEPKCKDCPWETCEEFHQTKTIPLDLCLDILKLLKEQEKQKFLVDENGKITPLPIVYPNCPLKEQEAVVRCKDCVHWDELTQACDEIDGIFLPDWFCADGERREDE